MTPRDLLAIRLVTTRYASLQGLHLALNGAIIALVFGGLSLTGVPPGAIAAFIGCLLQGGISAYLNHYYRTRFGVVDGSDDDLIVKWLVAVCFVAPVVLVLMGWNGGLLAIPFALAHLWVAIRDFPHRAHHLGGTVGATVALAMLWGSPLASNQLGNWALTLLGASMIVPGLLDHRLLVRTLGGGAGPRELPRISTAPTFAPGATAGKPSA